MNIENLAVAMGAKNYAVALGLSCRNWGISAPGDQARFIAQLSVESGGFKRVEENLRYSATRLTQVFGKRNGLTPAIAAQVAAAGPRAVANFIYGGEWGRKNLGNVEPDDGWNFRGRSLIQTTGRENYRATSIGCWGDLRLLDDPDLLLLPDNAAWAAGWFWYSRRLNGVTDVAEITRKINGGSNHLAERRAATERALRLVTQ